MTVLKGRNFIVNGQVIPPEPTDNVIITITMSSPTTPTLSFADMKYNKRCGMLMVADDGFESDYTQLYAYLHGGFPASNGTTYPGIRGTDGCGNPLEWHATFALNGGPRDEHIQGIDRAIWSEYNIMLANGYGLSNHGFDHGGYDKYYQVKQNEKYLFEKTGYRVRTMTIPTADEGYSETAPSLGYKLVGSTFGANSADDNNETGNQHVIFGSKVDVKTIDQTRLNKFLFARYFSLYWEPNDVNELKTLMDAVGNGSASGAQKFMGHFGMHGKDYQGSIANFIEVMQYFKNHANGGDNMWFPNMQEFVEYYETKINAIKNVTVQGNVLTAEINLSSIDSSSRLRDMSLLLGGANIQSISVSGADSYTYNTSTGLINIFKKNQSVRNPYADAVPPQIVECQRVGSNLTIIYDRPITQTVFQSAYGSAYSITNNTINSITGSGTTWTINCQSPIAASQTFDYKMQRGNAAGLDGLKVCSYIGYPIP